MICRSGKIRGRSPNENRGNRCDDALPPPLFPGRQKTQPKRIKHRVLRTPQRRFTHLQPTGEGIALRRRSHRFARMTGHGMPPGIKNLGFPPITARPPGRTDQGGELHFAPGCRPPYEGGVPFKIGFAMSAQMHIAINSAAVIPAGTGLLAVVNTHGNDVAVRL